MDSFTFIEQIVTGNPFFLCSADFAIQLHSDVVGPEPFIALVVVSLSFSFLLLRSSSAVFCVLYCFAGPCYPLS